MLTAKELWRELSTGPGLLERLSGYIIRPPRSEYELDHLGPSVFRIDDDDDDVDDNGGCHTNDDVDGSNAARNVTHRRGRRGGERYRRVDLELENMRGMLLQCSWFRPCKPRRQPCVVYCHANCGSRADSLEALFLLRHGFSLFAFDCCGSGMSEGAYISLGFYERQDLAAVVEYLTSQRELVDGIALWGRSMGAVTSIMYAAKDTTIRCIVCDSPFASLRLLIADLVAQHGGRTARYIPGFVIDRIVEAMRTRIASLAAFDINDLDTRKYARECAVPALIVHGADDTFVLPRQSRAVCEAFRAPCLHELVAGGHNDERDAATERLIVSFLHLFLVDKRRRDSLPSPQQPSSQQQQQQASATSAEAQRDADDKDTHTCEADTDDGEVDVEVRSADVADDLLQRTGELPQPLSLSRRHQLIAAPTTGDDATTVTAADDHDDNDDDDGDGSNK